MIFIRKRLVRISGGDLVSRKTTTFIFFQSWTFSAHFWKSARLELLNGKKATAQLVTEKDRKIWFFSQLVTEKDRKISAVFQLVTEKDRKIWPASQLVTEKDRTIWPVSQLVTKKDQLIIGNKSYHIKSCNVKFISFYICNRISHSWSRHTNISTKCKYLSYKTFRCKFEF